MGEVEDKDSKKEGEFTLVLEVRMKGYGHEKHKEQLAERVLRELETKFGYDEFKVYMVKEKKGSFADPLVAVKQRVYRSDRNASEAAATDADAGVGN